MRGVTKNLKICFSREETHLLAEHLDKDGDGHISYPEYHEKINFRDYHKKSQKYLISLKQFTDRILNEWYILRGEERSKIISKLMQFDANGDNLF